MPMYLRALESLADWGAVKDSTVLGAQDLHLPKQLAYGTPHSALKTTLWPGQKSTERHYGVDQGIHPHPRLWNYTQTPMGMG